VNGGLRIVAAPAGMWCEPETGGCHVDTAGEAASAEATDEDTTGGVPNGPSAVEP
jgi:hypothetical protein